MNSFPACFFLLLLRLDRLSTRNFVPDISHNRKKSFLFSFLFLFFLALSSSYFFKICCGSSLLFELRSFRNSIISLQFSWLMDLARFRWFFVWMRVVFERVLSAFLSLFIKFALALRLPRLWYRIGLKSIESFWYWIGEYNLRIKSLDWFIWFK